VLLEVTRAQRSLARYLVRVDETKATKAEIRNINNSRPWSSA